MLKPIILERNITLKYFYISLSLALSLINADAECIVISTNLVIVPSSQETFLHRFPSGSVIKYKQYYLYTMGPYDTRASANAVLPKVKQYYKTAFVAGCVEMMKVKNVSTVQTISDNKDLNTTSDTTSVPEKMVTSSVKDLNISKIEILKKPQFFNTYQMQDPFKQQADKDSNNSKIVAVNERELTNSNTEPTPSNQKALSNSCDTLRFQNYLMQLMDNNDQAEGIVYQKKIDYILSEIKKDKYNFDVYANGYVGTGSSLTSQTLGGTTGVVPNANGDYTRAGVSVNADKILYDGEYSLINNTYDILYKRLADISELSEKDKLIVLGTSIYTNLYTSQEELKIFEAMYDKQQEIEEIISQSYKKDQKSIIDYIDARNDSLTLQRAIMDLKYQHVNNDFILRQSIKSKSERPYKLFSEEFVIPTDSLPFLEKEALENNSDLVKESNILKLTQADLLSQQRRYYPQISFGSYVGYGFSDEKVFTTANAGTGLYWQLGLNVKVPIYNRDDIRLNEEKGMYMVLKEKTVFSAQQKSILLQVERSYHQIEKIEKQTKIIEEQLSLLSLKLKISKKRYLSGVSEYKVYSDALKGYLDYQNQMLKMKQQYTQEVSILSILVGRRNFYESN